MIFIKVLCMFERVGFQCAQCNCVNCDLLTVSNHLFLRSNIALPSRWLSCSSSHPSCSSYFFLSSKTLIRLGWMHLKVLLACLHAHTHIHNNRRVHWNQKECKQLVVSLHLIYQTWRLNRIYGKKYSMFAVCTFCLFLWFTNDFGIVLWTRKKMNLHIK